MRPQQVPYNTNSSSSSESIDEGIDRSFTESVIITGKTKIFNDMVHTHLELPALCYKIINTPQFQRLRNLKQLGLCYHIYPSACHNRFEHCIGTSYLAGKYCKILQKNQPEFEINDKDILCLYIAGLCHDLGHGPFSHTWEHFMACHKTGYSHEEMSIRMLDFLIEDNGLWELFQGEGLDDIDLVFIKELILGHPLKHTNDGSFGGRPPNKHFLYEIVSNDATKIDVDKFDYILRDCKQLNVTTAFDYERVLDNSRIFGVNMENGKILVADTIEINTPTKIAYRKKISETLEDLFRGRFSLHQKAYQHRVTKIIEEMVLDGLQAAEPYFRVTGRNGKEYKLSEAYKDISAFMKLTDSVFEMILYWGNGGIRAQTVFDRILRRNIYKCVGYLSSPFKEELLKDLEEVSPTVMLIKTKINYGKGHENPLNSALFYEKNLPSVLFHQVFSAPQTETKCFIVIRPSFDDGSIFNPDIQVKETERQVKEMAKRHGIRIELE